MQWLFDQTTIAEKNVYKIKRRSQKKGLQYKVCWVVKKFPQRVGINYTKILTLVVKHMS